MKRRIDEAAFIAAYDEYADAIFRFCYYKVQDRERAKDLMQETFTRAWVYLSEGKEIENLRAFLYKVARNLSVNELVRSKPLSMDELAEGGFDPKDTASRSPEENSEVAELLRVIETLDPHDSELLIMRYVDDMPVKEIAGVLEIAPNTVSVRIHRALDRLRSALHLP